MLLDKLITDIEERHKQRLISIEAYRRWAASSVTRRLMEELELELMVLLCDDTFVPKGEDAISYHAEKSIYNKGIKEATEGILKWKPVELLKDDDVENEREKNYED